MLIVNRWGVIMNTLENVKQWFIDRELENGGRLDKQSLKLSEEFGWVMCWYLKKNEQVTKDSIGDCAVVIVGLGLLNRWRCESDFQQSDSTARRPMESFIPMQILVSFNYHKGLCKRIMQTQSSTLYWLLENSWVMTLMNVWTSPSRNQRP